MNFIGNKSRSNIFSSPFTREQDITVQHSAVVLKKNSQKKQNNLFPIEISRKIDKILF